MVLVIKAESGPPCCHALRPKHRGRRGGRTVSDGQPGKPRETAGRKTRGLKRQKRQASPVAGSFASVNEIGKERKDYNESK